MTTPILGITEVAPAQVNQYAVVNDAIRALENAGNDFATVDLASGNVTLTAAQFSADLLFRSSGNAVARDLTLPAQRRLFGVHNNGSAALSVKLGSTTIAVAVGAYVLLYADGTTNGLASIGGGGGGLTNWTDGLSTAAPNTSTPVVSLTATNAASNVDVAISPKGLGAILADIPDSTAAGGNKRGGYAVDLQIARATAGQVASGDYSAVGGGQSNTASGHRSCVPGGEACIASGANSHAAGRTATASGVASSAIGEQVTADANYSRAGGLSAAVRGIYGADAFASGQFAAPGDAQRRSLLMRVATTDATVTAATTTGGAASAVNQAILPNTSAYMFKARIVARSSADSAAYEVTGLITRGANAASTALVGTPAVTVIAESGGAAAWDAAAVADTTGGGLQIQVTGAAATNIKWVVDLETVEVVG